MIWAAWCGSTVATRRGSACGMIGLSGFQGNGRLQVAGGQSEVPEQIGYRKGRRGSVFRTCRPAAVENSLARRAPLAALRALASAEGDRALRPGVEARRRRVARRALDPAAGFPLRLRL